MKHAVRFGSVWLGFYRSFYPLLRTPHTHLRILAKQMFCINETITNRSSERSRNYVRESLELYQTLFTICSLIPYRSSNCNSGMTCAVTVPRGCFYFNRIQIMKCEAFIVFLFYCACWAITCIWHCLLSLVATVKKVLLTLNWAVRLNCRANVM